MEANTISRVRPEADHTVLPKGRVVLEMEPKTTTVSDARRDGWLIAKPSSPAEKRVDNFINKIVSEPVVHELTHEFMDLLQPEQITALQAKTIEINKSGLSALESKIKITKAMLEIVSDDQAYQIVQNMTEAMTGEHANHDQVMSVIDMYKNISTAEIIDSLVAQLDQSAEKIPSQAKLADPILV
ncbi:MAG: hypothetical protein O2962_07755, partial [Cyanobacteria bacterium]|nr:hypothetical protein [Cyanobacteriota bacterium]